MSCTNTDPVEIHECQEGGIRGDPDKDVIVSTPPPPPSFTHYGDSDGRQATVSYPGCKIAYKAALWSSGNNLRRGCERNISTVSQFAALLAFR